MDYLITLGRAADGVAGARGEIILPSLPSLCTFPPPLVSEGLAQDYHMRDDVHLGFPEFTRFSLTDFPVRLR